jgi:hypothetical protein
MSDDKLPPKGWTAYLVRQHLQNAIYLEMWTVPLYLASAYSLDVPINSRTHRPEFAAVPTKPDGKPNFDSFTQQDYNQYAFNNILSVAIQEMLHVELACNLLNAVRPDSAPVTFTGVYPPPTPPRSAPNYDSPPACLADDQLPSGVQLRLGRCNKNQVLLFQWVETDQPLPPKPYDVEAWHATYNSIGHFYTSLMYGMKACWADLYPQQGRADDPYQRDDWETTARLGHGRLLKLIFSGPQLRSAQPTPEGAGDTLDETSYKDFSIKIFGSPHEARIRAEAAMTAIKVQGEGAGGTQEIPTKFQPTGDPKDAIEIALDKVSHWERFHELVKLAEDNKFTYVQYASDPDPEHFRDALNQSYSSFLSSLNDAFSNNGSMSIAAMAGLGNRVLQAWQNGVGVDEMFQWVDGSAYIDPGGSKGYHACQGLDPKGVSDCATGFYHTCATANMCQAQGGCGATAYNGETNITWLPDANACQGKGHCGIPIPADQCFDDSGALKGQSVWKYARELMRKKYPDFPPESKDPKPNDLRNSLTSTSGVKCSSDK